MFIEHMPPLWAAVISKRKQSYKANVSRAIILATFVEHYLPTCKSRLVVQHSYQVSFKSGVEINTGLVARGQWICCRASEICYPLARLAFKILKPNF